MSEKELTEAALAENIFRITHWNWLKPKKSKLIVTVFDFHNKKQGRAMQRFLDISYAETESIGLKVFFFFLWLQFVVFCFTPC